MSYNVLWGGGVDREFDSVVAPKYQTSRLEGILALIKAASPDVLAVQEAAGWDRGSPSIAAQVAAALGMHYVIARDDVNLNVVLFSRYPIENVQYAARRDGFYSGFNGVLLMAQLVLDGGYRLNVYAPHLNSQSGAVRSCQTQALLRLAAAYSPGPSLIIGDMNSRPSSPQSQILQGAGWQFVAAESTWTVDQVWLGPGLAFRSAVPLDLAGATRDLSDHLPAGVSVTLSLTGSAPAGKGSDAPLAESCPPPE